MPLNNLSVAQIKVGVLMWANALIRKRARREHCRRHSEREPDEQVRL